MAANLVEATVIVASATSIDVPHIAPVETHERSGAPKVDDSVHRLEEHQLSHDGTGPWFQANTNYTLPDLTANLRVVTLDLMAPLAQDRDFTLGTSRTESAATDTEQHWVMSGPHATRTPLLSIMQRGMRSRRPFHAPAPARPRPQRRPRPRP